jgi:hypothetical protein
VCTLGSFLSLVGFVMFLGNIAVAIFRRDAA